MSSRDIFPPEDCLHGAAFSNDCAKLFGSYLRADSNVRSLDGSIRMDGSIGPQTDS